MPRHNSDEQRDARALQKAEGIKYTDALARVRANKATPEQTAEAAQPVRATLGADDRGEFTLTLHYPAFIYPARSAVIDRDLLVTERTTTIDMPRGWRPEHGVAHTLYWMGWEVADGTDLKAIAAAGGGQLNLTRSERGQLEDQANEIRGGVPFDETAVPYAAAVAAALETAGITVVDWDVVPDEDRRIYITLANSRAGADPDEVEDDDDQRWVVAWIDTQGWFTFLEAARGEALGSCARDLDCGVMATPEQVAAAVLDTADRGYLGGFARSAPVQSAANEWRPPAGYVEDPEITGDATDIILDLERSLMAYRHHPAWLAHAAGMPAPPPGGENPALASSITAPVYILIHPDGRAEWGDQIAVAEQSLGPHGIGRAFLHPGSRLRFAMSDCALILRKEYPPNPYAQTALAHVAGLPREGVQQMRGCVALFGWDPRNDWDSTRSFTAAERDLIDEALTVADCTTA